MQGGMKKVGLFLLAVVMVAGLAGCGGSGGDDDYNFSGTCMFEERIAWQNCFWQPWMGLMTIQQNWNVITVTFPDYHPVNGGADSGAGTFSLAWTEGNYTASYKDQAVDDNTMFGTGRTTQGACIADSAWTAELVGR